MEEEKNSKVRLIFLTVIIVLLVGLAGYLIYDKLTNKVAINNNVIPTPTSNNNSVIPTPTSNNNNVIPTPTSNNNEVNMFSEIYPVSKSNEIDSLKLLLQKNLNLNSEFDTNYSFFVSSLFFLGTGKEYTINDIINNGPIISNDLSDEYIDIFYLFDGMNSEITACGANTDNPKVLYYSKESVIEMLNNAFGNNIIDYNNLFKILSTRKIYEKSIYLENEKLYSEYSSEYVNTSATNTYYTLLGTCGAIAPTFQYVSYLKNDNNLSITYHSVDKKSVKLNYKYNKEKDNYYFYSVNVDLYK